MAQATSTRPAKKKRAIQGKHFWKDSLLAYIFLLPTIVILGVFTFYPFVSSFFISLHEGAITNPLRTYVGFEHYQDLFKDRKFWKAMWNTGYYVLFSVPTTMILALFFAVLLNAKIRFQGIFRTLFFLPYITPTVAAAVVWEWVFNRRYGLFNDFINFFGIPSQDWIDNPNLALPMVILFSIWKYMGFQIVIFLAGLQNISKEYYEAAAIDGANAWQQFWKITLPLLTPVTFFVLIISMIGAFKVFDEIFVIFDGTTGPLDSAMTVMIFFFQTAFGRFKMGYASAIAYTMFVIIFLFTLLQTWYARRRIHYGG
jgi:multiple sugar transport system permease protein